MMTERKKGTKKNERGRERENPLLPKQQTDESEAKDRRTSILCTRNKEMGKKSKAKRTAREFFPHSLSDRSDASQ
jgi:hypothetical protein